jgi:hypothetical protein
MKRSPGANPENVIKNGFKKNPQNINRKGKPKKALTSIMEYLEKTYGKPIPKAESIKLLEYIETLPISKLVEFVKDQELPAIVQAYGRLLLTGDQKDMRRVSAAELIKDRVHGKPKQAIEHSGNVSNEPMSKEERDKLKAELEEELKHDRR